MNDELEQVQTPTLSAFISDYENGRPIFQAELEALIQQERKKAAREALEGVRQKTVMNPAWPIKYLSLRSELSEQIDEALKELDGFDWRQGYGGESYESTKTA